MISPELTELISGLPEPMLLLRAGGILVAGNAPALQMLQRSAREAGGVPLQALVEDSPAKVDSFLQACTRTRQGIPGALHFRSRTGQVLDCKVQGGLAQASSVSEPILWLRLLPRSAANSRFLDLNLKIERLAREITARQEAEALLQAQKQVLELVVQGTETGKVLEGLCQLVEEQSKSGVLASILLLDHDGKYLRYGAAPSLPPAYNRAIDGVRIGQEVGSCGTAAYLRQPVIVEDIASDRRWKDYRELALSHGLRACWSTPIFSRDQRVLGTFAMYYREPRAPTGHDQRIIDLVTRTAAIAIEKEHRERERQKTELALRRSEKLAAAGRFAATVAHEINNPLEAVTNLIYLALRAPGLSPGAQEYLQMADKEVARVGHIAQQALRFYRDPTSATEIDLSRMMDDILNVYSGRTEHKRLQLLRQYHSPAVIQGMAGELRQVFGNLVLNAIDASRPDGKIVVRIASRQRWGTRPQNGVRVTIADAGKGIAAEHRQRLFEPFFTTKQEVGTGLGLWVTRGIVEKHGGAIRFRSSQNSKHGGTTFVVFLPLGQTLEAAAD
jgi:signal transduction histidine kinase